MPSTDTSPDITIGYSRLSLNDVWFFFSEIRDISNSTPAEEQIGVSLSLHTFRRGRLQMNWNRSDRYRDCLCDRLRV
jgi:hypothetical protein